LRSESQSIVDRNAPLVERMFQLKSEHPFWGYRRIWAHLRYIDGVTVNKKRVLRLMRLHGLTVTQETRLKAKRTSSRSKPRPDRPNQWWGIDMTKAMTDSGWVYIVIVLDWYSKKVVGHHAGSISRAPEWLEALDEAVNAQFPDGVRGHDLHLMSDNGSQPTSTRFMKACSSMEVHQAFTCYNNPKGNADAERMMRTLKEELIWLREWSNPTEVADALATWIKQYDESYLHSAHGYKPPNEAERSWNLKKDTLLEVA